MHVCMQGGISNARVRYRFRASNEPRPTVSTDHSLQRTHIPHVVAYGGATVRRDAGSREPADAFARGRRQRAVQPRGSATASLARLHVRAATVAAAAGARAYATAHLLVGTAASRSACTRGQHAWQRSTGSPLQDKPPVPAASGAAAVSGSHQPCLGQSAEFAARPTTSERARHRDATADARRSDAGGAQHCVERSVSRAIPGSSRSMACVSECAISAKSRAGWQTTAQ